MRISDWSSDVCSSDLRLQPRVPTRASEPQGPCPLRLPEVPGLRHLRSSNQWFLRQFSVSENDPQERSRRTRQCRGDTKSGVEGKGVSVTVDLGGRRLDKHKIMHNTQRTKDTKRTST